jgi:N-acetylneuraminate synthase/N,N'-diacetyllegionaminate synthase
MNKTLIIAEAGVNHNGNIELAKKLIDVAAEAGVDYVKFQTFKAENLVSKSAKKAAYQIKNTNEEGSQYDMLKNLELDLATHHVLIDYCNSKSIQFLSTGFDLESLDLLNDLKINIFKVPSGEITNLPYLKKIASFNKPVILSTGMCTLKEVKEAFQVILDNGIPKENITILHCNTEYPTPMEDVNLKAMLTIQEELNVKVGYSDHTLGIEVPIAAVAMGAVCVEKHFTLDKTMKGPDHKASLEPNELNQMVLSIRNIEKALGNGRKEPSKSEQKNRAIARKSIHINNNLSKGHILTEDDFIMMRPGDGISPMDYEKLIGRKIVSALTHQHKLSLEDIE